MFSLCVIAIYSILYTYKCLYHVDSVLPHLIHTSKDVYHTLLRSLLQKVIKGYQGTCPTNTRAGKEHNKSATLTLNIWKSKQKFSTSLRNKAYPSSTMINGNVNSRGNQVVGKVA